MREIKPGIYRHFKGNEYRVLGVAKSSEDLEEKFVVYYPLYETAGDVKMNIRPLEMFAEEIERDGKRMQRFQLISELPGIDELLED
jgi:hypothetical protein